MARRYHIVKSGDTLGGIARQYNTTVNKLAAVNDISNVNLISVGEKIWIDPDTASPKPKPKNTKTVRVKQFGQVSDGKAYSYFAVWEWDQPHTDYFYVKWEYQKEGCWWEGSYSKLTYDPYATRASKQSIYDAPEGAVAIRFKVRPFSKTKKSDNGSKETHYWTADWCDYRIRYLDTSIPPTPEPPTVSAVDDNNQIRIEALSIPIETFKVQFRIWIEDEDDGPNHGHVYATTDVYHPDESGGIICLYNVHRGRRYKVAMRIGNTERWSEWSAYSSEYVSAIPTTPSGIKTLRAETGFGESNSQGSVYIYWYSSRGADSYLIGYSENRDSFVTGENITTYDTAQSADPKAQHHKFDGIAKGKEYFFSVKAKNQTGETPWCPIKSLISGTEPAAPSIWASSDVVVVGEQSKVYLHWQHNSKDSSYERYAAIEFSTVNPTGDTIRTEVVKAHPNQTEEDKHKPGEYIIDPTKDIVGDDGVSISLADGATIKWRVKTAGVLLDENGPVYGPYSVARELKIYTKPSVSIIFGGAEHSYFKYPITFSIQGSGFYNQVPVGCSVAVIAKNSYDAQDETGDPIRVNAGDAVYRKYLSGTPEDELYSVTIMPGDAMLENGQTYIVKTVMSSSSGLDASTEDEFTTQFESDSDGVSLDAEITFNKDGFTATILPICKRVTTSIRRVVYRSGKYVLTATSYNSVYQISDFPVGYLETGEPVYEVFPDIGNGNTNEYASTISSSEIVSDVKLSVYRREFDGELCLVATDIQNNGVTYATDPHPALDYARYRIVAISSTSGWVAYYDLPGVPTDIPGVVIQWADNWKNYNQTDETEAVQEIWSGSFLHLPYNLDVTESTKPDVVNVDYIGRSHPVAYYGTQVGQSASWQVVVPSDDLETVYALRRLARWTGIAYVREQYGTGYWATVEVSLGQKHCDLTIPVTLHIIRVEGGEA